MGASSTLEFKRKITKNYDMFFKLLAIVCILQQITMVLSYPNHAQCELKWNIPGNCNDIGNRLIAQMNLWNDDSNCGKVSESCPKMPCGQNCLYTFVNATENGIINGIHTTPVKRYTDTISFKFQSYTSQYSERCFIDVSVQTVITINKIIFYIFSCMFLNPNNFFQFEF